MPASRSLPVGNGYLVTPQGHEDLASAPLCVCNVRLDGLLFSCPDCGTVYGIMREQDPGRYARQDKPA